MASLIYTKFIHTALKADIDFDTITVKCMLVTSSYTADKDHDYRDDITNEVSGTGYTAGGATATVSLTLDTTNDREDITLGAVSWTTSTITARGAVYYAARGGASSADDVIAYIDFGSNITSTAGTFALTASTLRLQN